ncbi:extracellular solute-binding protein [Mobilitalea sibirica]|uniref:Extracellular solute-binding protein n=1 Tax=Mobilitalea sibirica TaxID=1462919 RepID=A0A8J7H0F1_9FIRM|nr:extracellular solute-binding protein [Mobilitalea sibirica]MBH1939538.1 extracellular solute-binding protein [Mobilitalea sibirica]
MSKMKKISAFLLLLVMTVFILAACSRGEEEANKTATPTPEAESSQEEDPEEAAPTATPTPEPPRDLGGIEITVGDWWSTGEVAEPATQRDEDTLLYREDLQAKHNFKLSQVNIGAWAEYQEIFITSTMAGDPAADIFIMDQKFVPEPLKQGMFYPLSDLPSFDFSDDLWNASMTDYMTQNGKVYGFTEEQNSPGLGVFFNKRLFEEAGLEPDLLYDLQASGEWTWAKLEELCNVLTRDTNSDGITDVYSIVAWQVEVPKAAVFSNGSDYVRFNEETGRYENNQDSDEYLAAVNLAVDLYNKGHMMPDPEGAEFTWFENAFVSGKGAMMVTEWYRNSALQSMEDDWGYVFFPKGPSGDRMQTMYTGNVRVMPAGLDAKLADDIAFAYTKWVSAPPGYEDAEGDLSNYYALVRDSRAVEETIKPMVEGQGVRSLLYQVPGLSYKYGSNMDGGGLGALSAVEIAEAASAQFDAIINDFYAE